MKPKSEKRDFNDLLKTIGKNVRKHRHNKGLSQEDLAYSSDIDRTYIGYIENGKNNVTVKKLHEIAQVLEIQVSDLFEEE